MTSADTTSTAPSPSDVREAAARLEGVAVLTPVVRARGLEERAGAEVYCKCESLQRGGAFKFRGAYNAVSRLSLEALARGVVTYSSGNHALAVALAARLLGTTSVVVMPTDAPLAKADAARHFGATVVPYDRYRDDRVAIAETVASERGLTLVRPSEHPHVIAGQGTVGLELLSQVPDLDTLVVPVGVGGLVAGIATIATALVPGISVVGVEPEAGDDTRQSIAAGKRVRIAAPRSIADGLGADTPGELTFEINRRLLSRIEVVGDDEIREAMRFCFEQLKLVVEPSGAVGVAAVLGEKITGAKRIGVVLSGGNVDVSRFGELFGAR
ncbi:MAG: threonine/serine dehydratase [Acidimicrobiales bacterium]